MAQQALPIFSCCTSPWDLVFVEDGNEEGKLFLEIFLAHNTYISLSHTVCTV